MAAIGIALVIVSCYLAWRYPPLGLAIYMLCSLGGDAVGICGFLEVSGLGYLSYLGRLIAFCSVTKSFVVLYRQRTRIDSRRLWRYAFLVTSVCIAIALGSAFRNVPPSRIMVEVFTSGLPLSLVALAYFRDRRAKQIYVSVVFLQLLLAFFIVLFPGPFQRLSAIHFYRVRDAERLPAGEFTGTFSRDDGEAPRQFAQFYRPTGYGMYAAVGLILGAYMALSNRKEQVVASLPMLALAIFGVVASLARGAPTGAVLGLGSVALLNGGTFIQSRPIRIGLIWVATAIILPFTASFIYQGLTDVFSMEQLKDGVNDRLVLANKAYDNIVRHPLFGSPYETFDSANGYIPPHQLCLYYGERNGIIAGLFGLYVMVYLSWEWPRRLVRASLTGTVGFAPRNTDTLLVALLPALLITTLFNNFGAANLFWITWGYMVAVSPPPPRAFGVERLPTPVQAPQQRTADAVVSANDN